MKYNEYVYRVYQSGEGKLKKKILTLSKSSCMPCSKFNNFQKLEQKLERM